MKPRTIWVLVAIAMWSVLAGCSRRQEATNEDDKQPEIASRSVGETARPLAVDTTETGSIAEAETSGKWIEPGAGTPVLSYVSNFVGSTPVETGLWRSKPLAYFLYKALGPRYETLQINMQETGPIQQENGVVYVMGKKKYSEDRAAVAIDTATDGIYIWLLVGGKAEEYQWGEAAITLPTAIRKLVDETGSAP